MNKSFTYLAFVGFFLFFTTSTLSAQKTSLKLGKYNCTASKYSGGYYEYTPKGYFIIDKSGNYTYYGFQKPSVGKYTVDSKGNLLFKGGYFDGGKGEKIDRPNKFFITFPANPDNRWTASLADK